MSLFTSRREQRLWLWTLAVVLAVYATLGSIPVLADYLRSQDLLAAFFLFCMLLTAAAVVAHGFKARWGRVEIAVVLGITAVYLMLFLRISLLEERSHLFEYSVVGILIYEALVERTRNGARLPLPALIAALVTAVLGTLDEVIQDFLPNRVFDPVDILFNVLAGALAVGASLALDWARRRRKKQA